MAKGLVVDFKYLPSRENLLWVVVGGVLALAVHPADDDVNRALPEAVQARGRAFVTGTVLTVDGGWTAQ